MSEPAPLRADATLALLYDIHGNLPALDAVLGDAASAGAGGFVLGGDYCLFGAWPAETLARLRELAPAAWIRGNGERWSARPAQAPDDATVQDAVAACREALGAERIAALAELPQQLALTGRSVRCCHASPISDVRSFAPAPSSEDAELLGPGSSERMLVFGHTHVPFRRPGHGGIELVNPGSVGMPFDGDPRAAYALLAADGSVTHRRIAYDHNASAAALREHYGAGWAEVVARRIETARFA